MVAAATCATEQRRPGTYTALLARFYSIITRFYIVFAYLFVTFCSILTLRITSSNARLVAISRHTVTNLHLDFVNQLTLLLYCWVVTAYFGTAAQHSLQSFRVVVVFSVV